VLALGIHGRVLLRIRGQVMGEKIPAGCSRFACLEISERYFIEAELVALQALGDITGFVKEVADAGLEARQLVVKGP
jgi:hypothetical protein